MFMCPKNERIPQVFKSLSWVLNGNGRKMLAGTYQEGKILNMSWHGNEKNGKRPILADCAPFYLVLYFLL
jgi:hypothetical protein